MTSPFVPDSFDDEIPVADSVEQARPVVEPAEQYDYGDDSPPLESDESDWQEQQLVVEDPDDDFR